MFNFTNHDGTAQDRSKSVGVKVRLAQVFRKNGQSTLEIMAELKMLSDKDLADFKGWFEQEGYSCN